MNYRIKKSIAFLLLMIFAMPTLAQTDRQLEREKANQKTEKRTALVIGNSDYKIARKLANPVNDATDMTAALTDVGFEVISGTNLNLKQMTDKVREFGDKLKANGGVGLFYYAGHGVQVGGKNYLIPVEADVSREDEIAFAALNFDIVLQKMATANNGLNIVILDACRNNPFARSWSRNTDDGGLAQVTAPTGTFIAYATSPDKTASDGDGRNGLYTAQLLKIIRQPNLKIEEAFKQVTIAVDKASGGNQIPWTSSSLRGEFYFKKSEVVAAVTNNQTTEPVITATPKPTPLPTPTPVSVAANIDAEELYWQEINRRDTKSGYELYLDEYPKGKYAVQANNKIEQFKKEELQKQKDIERSKWRETQNQNTRESYNSYLRAYPNGEFAADARSSITALDTKEEQVKWDEVQILNRKSAYQSYLSAYPNGKNAGSARQKIKEFDDEEARKLKEQEKAKEKAKWDDAERLKTADGYKEYLTAYPSGEFARLARLHLRDLGVTVSPTNTTNSNTSLNTTAGAISKARLPGGAEMNFVYIPAGDFMMGSDKYDDEKPIHKVTISQSFFMGQTEVTQAQWQAVMGNNPSSFKNCPNCPVETVSWEDAQQFISKLNAQNDGFKYGLPTEAEWEYAARAGTTGDYAGNLDSMAWYSANSGSKTHEVGTKQANGWGLYDMHGNVWEWVQDLYDSGYYAKSSSVDPTGASSGSYRVYRGVGWGNDAVNLRSALRSGVSPSFRISDLGFRVVRMAL